MSAGLAGPPPVPMNDESAGWRTTFRSETNVRFPFDAEEPQPRSTVRSSVFVANCSKAAKALGRQDRKCSGNEAEDRLEFMPDLWGAGWHFPSHLGRQAWSGCLGFTQMTSRCWALVCRRAPGNVDGVQRFVRTLFPSALVVVL